MSVLRYIRMILWAFFGVRRRAGAAEEFANGSALGVIVTGIVAAACFVAALLALVSLAVSSLG